MKCSVMQVVAATCVGSGDIGNVGFREFRMVVIDEATQSIEPSTLIPLVIPPSLVSLMYELCTIL